jgi:predicted RNase H-like HicB family nuclease
MASYNLSLIFYPQRNGGYTVICPEIPGCIGEGDSIDEATVCIRDVIADMLPDAINVSADDEETLRLGLCMEGKIYQDMKVTVNGNDVTFPPIAIKTVNIAV